MRRSVFFTCMAVMFSLAALCGTARATVYQMEVVNLTKGIYFTPLLVTAHGAGVSLFTPGVEASDALQAMAEGGDISGLSAAIGGADADTVANPAAGLLGPGMSTMFTLDNTASGHMYLSLAGMLLPTNDGFVGLDSIPLPTGAGVYRIPLYGYDAGTEANNELMNTVDGGMPGVPGIPADPGGMAGSGGSGVTNEVTNTTVHIHRGVLGDLDDSGGNSDLDPRYHRWLNPVALLIITVN